MDLSKETISEFKEIMSKEFNIDISDEVAEQQAKQVLSFLNIIFNLN